MAPGSPSGRPQACSLSLGLQNTAVLSRIGLFVTPWAVRARMLEWAATPSSGAFSTRGPNPQLLCLLHWPAGLSPPSLLGSPLRSGVEAGDSVVTWDTFHERTLSGHWGQRPPLCFTDTAGAGKWVQSPRQPRAGQPTQACADPGRTSAEGQAPGGRGQGTGLPDWQVCKPGSVTTQRFHSTVWAQRHPRCSQQQAGSVHCKQRTSPAHSHRRAGSGPLWWAVRGEEARGAAPSCPRWAVRGGEARGAALSCPCGSREGGPAAGTDRCRDSELYGAGWGSSVDWGEQPSPEEKDHRTLYHLSSQGSRLLGRAPQILRRVHSHKRVVKQPLPPSPFLGLSHTAKLNFSPF